MTTSLLEQQPITLEELSNKSNGRVTMDDDLADRIFLLQAYAIGRTRTRSHDNYFQDGVSISVRPGPLVLIYSQSAPGAERTLLATGNPRGMHVEPGHNGALELARNTIKADFGFLYTIPPLAAKSLELGESESAQHHLRD